MGEARLLERVELTSTLAILRIVPDGGVPEFRPGQYTALGLPLPSGRMLWRAYSIASAPEERRFLEYYVRWIVAPVPGRLTTRLFRLKPGDRVQWKPPRGTFTLPEDDSDGRRLLLVGGGAGLAPLASMVRHLDAAGTARDVVLCHGASHAAELGYADELRDLERRSRAGRSGIPRFRYLATVSRPKAGMNRGWSGPTGRVETLLPDAVERELGAPLAPESTLVFVCGSGGTVAAVLAALAPPGFRPRDDPREDGSYDVLVESWGGQPASITGGPDELGGTLRGPGLVSIGA